MALRLLALVLFLARIIVSSFQLEAGAGRAFFSGVTTSRTMETRRHHHQQPQQSAFGWLQQSVPAKLAASGRRRQQLSFQREEGESAAPGEDGDEDWSEDDQVLRGATFLTLKLGRALLQKKALQDEVERRTQEARDRQQLQKRMDAERPANLHRREGDRIVALGDQFSPQQTYLEQQEDGEEQEAAAALDSTSEAVPSVQTDEELSLSDVPTASPPDSSFSSSSFPPPPANIEFSTTAAAAASSASTAFAPVPDVISREFGRPLEVVESNTPTLRKPIEEMAASLPTPAAPAVEAEDMSLTSPVSESVSSADAEPDTSDAADTSSEDAPPSSQLAPEPLDVNVDASISSSTESPAELEASTSEEDGSLASLASEVSELETASTEDTPLSSLAPEPVETTTEPAAVEDTAFPVKIADASFTGAATATFIDDGENKPPLVPDTSPADAIFQGSSSETPSLEALSETSLMPPYAPTPPPELSISDEMYSSLLEGVKSAYEDYQKALPVDFPVPASPATTASSAEPVATSIPDEDVVDTTVPSSPAESSGSVTETDADGASDGATSPVHVTSTADESISAVTPTKNADSSMPTADETKAAEPGGETETLSPSGGSTMSSATTSSEAPSSASGDVPASSTEAGSLPKSYSPFGSKSWAPANPEDADKDTMTSPEAASAVESATTNTKPTRKATSPEAASAVESIVTDTKPTGKTTSTVEAASAVASEPDTSDTKPASTTTLPVDITSASDPDASEFQLESPSSAPVDASASSFTDGSSKPTSYSPFGSKSWDPAKPAFTDTESDTKTSPVDTSSPAESETESSSPAPGEISAPSDSGSEPKSYSPFGSKSWGPAKPASTDTESDTKTSPVDTTSPAESEPESSSPAPGEVSAPSHSGSEPKSYSPFGSRSWGPAKPASTDTDTKPSPFDTTAAAESESESASQAPREVSTSTDSDSEPKSYSPFGSKPWAPAKDTDTATLPIDSTTSAAESEPESSSSTSEVSSASSATDGSSQPKSFSPFGSKSWVPAKPASTDTDSTTSPVDSASVVESGSAEAKATSTSFGAPDTSETETGGASVVEKDIKSDGDSVKGTSFQGIQSGTADSQESGTEESEQAPAATSSLTKEAPGSGLMDRPEDAELKSDEEASPIGSTQETVGTGFTLSRPDDTGDESQSKEAMLSPLEEAADAKAISEQRSETASSQEPSTETDTVSEENDASEIRDVKERVAAAGISAISEEGEDDVIEKPLTYVERRALKTMLEEGKLDRKTEQEVRKILNRGTVRVFKQSSTSEDAPEEVEIDDDEVKDISSSQTVEIDDKAAVVESSSSTEEEGKRDTDADSDTDDEPVEPSSGTTGDTLDGEDIRGPITPVGNIILVKVKETLTATTGGILLPDQAKERPTEGLVIAAGPGKLHPFTGVRITNPIEPGMSVLYGKFDGRSVEYNGDDCQVIRDDDVLLAYHGVTMKLDNVMPVRDYVLVEVVKKDESLETKSGVAIASQVVADLNDCEGRVVKIGPGRMASDGQFTKSPVQPGDYVKFKDYAGNEVLIEGKEYSVVKMVDILSTFNEEQVTEEKPKGEQKVAEEGEEPREKKDGGKANYQYGIWNPFSKENEERVKKAGSDFWNQFNFNE